MKRYFLLALLLVSISGFAQNTINNYKNVLVPEQFNFLKQKDQYNLNTLAKNLLADKGFTAYFDNSELPAEISGNRCSALTLEVVGKSSMFSTNMTILLKDCKGNVLFKSKEGKSREKEYDVSYNLALRDAFTSLNALQYVENASVTMQVQQVIKTTEISFPAAQPGAKTVTETIQTAGTLYAQPTANGYQLIDTAPKVILTLFKTSVEGYFIANKGLSNGIVFKKDENWFFESYKDGKLIVEKLLIKF